MMEQIKKIANTLIELYLMAIRLTCIWFIWKVIMVIFMLMVIHVMVTILSNFFHLHIPFKNTWLLVVGLFLPVKWYVKELFFSISILIIMLYKKINPIIKFVSIGKIFNGNFNVIFHDSKDVVPYSLRSISQKYFSTLSLLHVPMEEHDNIMYKNNRIKIV